MALELAQISISYRTAAMHFVIRNVIQVLNGFLVLFSNCLVATLTLLYCKYLGACRQTYLIVILYTRTLCKSKQQHKIAKSQTSLKYMLNKRSDRKKTLLKMH